MKYKVIFIAYFGKDYIIIQQNVEMTWSEVNAQFHKTFDRFKNIRQELISIDPRPK
jgi:hypothetical protein